MMRRIILFTAVVALVGATVALPATAAPVKNVFTYDAGCPGVEGLEAFTIKAVGVPGWMVAEGDGWAQVPSLFMGGEGTFTDETGTFPFVDLPPAGLMALDKLTTCWIEGPTDENPPFQVEIYPAYIYWLQAPV